MENFIVTLLLLAGFFTAMLLFSAAFVWGLVKVGAINLCKR